MKSISKNYFFNLAYQLILALLPLVTTPYLARILDADKIGVYSFAHSFVSYFTLFAVLGTSLYGQVAVARTRVRGESLKQIFAELFAFRIVNVIFALSVYFGVFFRFVDDRALYLVAALEILAVAFDISWFYQGIEEFGKIVFCNGLSKFLAAILIFTFVKTREDLALYAFINAGMILLSNLSMWAFLPSKLWNSRVGKMNIIQHVRPSLTLFLSQFSIQIYTVLDRTMIGLISRSDFESGYYDQAQRLVKTLTAIVVSVSTVMASRVAMVWNYGKKGFKNEITDLILFSFRLGFSLGCPIAVGLFIVAERFVPFYWGPGFETVAVLLRYPVWIIPIIVCSNIIGMQLLVPSERSSLMTNSVMFGAVVNFGMNLLLIPKLYALGAVISSVIAEATVSVIQFYYVRKELNIFRVLNVILRYIVYSAVMGILGTGLLRVLPVGAGSIMMVIPFCMVIYGGLLIVTRDPVLGILHKDRPEESKN